MQPRNSNLRELPIAPGNTNMNSSRPAANVRPVAKATQGVRPEQSTQAVPAGGRGRGQNFAQTDLHPGGEGSAVVRKEEAQVSFLALQILIIYLFLHAENDLSPFMHWRFTFMKIPIRSLMNLSHYIGNNKSILLNFALECVLRLHLRAVV